MLVQETSLFTYRTEILPTLGARQRVVYEEIQKHGDITNNELSASLNIPINGITPRVHELRALGKVEKSCKRTDRVTGRTVIAWKAKYDLWHRQ